MIALKQALLSTVILALCLAILDPGPAWAGDKQPNIMWIVTDDQRPDSLQAYNRAVFGTDHSPLGYVESPVADALAAEGTLFINAFNNSPACGPSRGSFHSGRYPFRNGHYAFEQTHQEPDFTRPVVMETLRDLGYTSASFGKSDSYIYRWGPGQGFHNPGHWDHRIHFKNQLQKVGYGDLFGNTAYGPNWTKLGQAEWAHYPDGRVKEYFMSRVDGPITEEDKRIRAEVEEEFDILRSYTRGGNKNLIIGGVNPMPADKTVDARVVDEFESHLANADQGYKTVWGLDVQGPDSSKPVLMHLGFHLPHTPVLPPKSIRERFQKETYKVPKFDKDAEVSKLPPQLLRLFKAMNFDDMTDAEKQQAIQDYYAFCAHGDALMGRAIESFKAYSAKQDRYWLIIFLVGDHSWHLGEQGIEAKFGPWHHSVGNAIIMASSDKSLVPEGKVYNGLVEYVDLAPTLIQAAGGDIEQEQFDYLDGYSLVDVVHERKPKRDYILGEMNLVIGPRAYMHSERFRFSMRTRPFDNWVTKEQLGKNLKWALNAPVEKVDLALYDLKYDPMERNNVAADPEYRELAAFFREKLGNIVLGDGRVECDWSEPNTYHTSNFAEGADDKKLAIPAELLP
ncbi:MAG: sulfatase-like hydrolase/transferase [Planctomycetota bacterium]